MRYATLQNTVRLAVCLAGLLAAATATAAPEHSRFYGVYDGEAVLESDGIIQTRDLKVSIAEEGDGFNLTWMLVTHKAEGKVKRQEFSINFEPTRRNGIYRSAMRQNVFGQQIPMDPLKGDPYIWGRVDGDIMTIYAMIILDDGGYEMQQWVRKLTDRGMSVSFSRVRNGEIMRTVQGELRRH